MGGFQGLGAEIQLEIDFGKIEVAESQHVCVAIFFAFEPGGTEHFDGPAVFATKVVEVGDVVVGLGDQQCHTLLHAHFTGALVGGEGARKIVQGDQTNRHVVERDREAFGIPQRDQGFIGALVTSEAFLKAVLAVVDVAEIDFDVREALAVAELRENLFGAFGGFKRLVVTPQQDQRLNGRNERATFLGGVADPAKNLESLLVEDQSLAIVAEDADTVALGSQGTAEYFLAAKATGDDDGRLNERERLLGINTQPGATHFVQLLADGLPIQLSAREKSSTRSPVAEFRKFAEQLFVERPCSLRRSHEKPAFSNSLRARSRQRWRMKPIEPVAIPRVRATSAYGRAGSSKKSMRISSWQRSGSAASTCRSFCSSWASRKMRSAWAGVLCSNAGSFGSVTSVRCFSRFLWKHLCAVIWMIHFGSASGLRSFDNSERSSRHTA